MNLIDQYEQNLKQVIKKIDRTQQTAMKEAGLIICETAQKEGLVYSFGSGHSFGAALEIAGRAGGYINSKSINNFLGSNGIFEVVPGIGTEFAKYLDVRENDCFVIISNSGRNILHLELANYIKKKGIKLILVTHEEAAKNAKTVTAEGKNLYELADVVLDNCGFAGDCSITFDPIDAQVGPTSSISVAYILNKVILYSYLHCESKGFIPPVYKSANIDGGREYNQTLREKYKERLQ